MNGTFDYEYELHGEVFSLQVEWEQTGSARPATRLEPAEYDEVDIHVTLDGQEFTPDKDTYTKLLDHAYLELETAQDIAHGRDEDAEYERYRQRMIDDD